MGKFKEKFARFMQGRYGIDQLYYAFIALYFILAISNYFVRSTILGVAMWLVLIVMIFRFFSKNIYRRQAENRAFLKLWNPVRSVFDRTRRRYIDRRTHVYRRCPLCKAQLRLPKRKGQHTVECPRCHKDFKVKV